MRQEDKISIVGKLVMLAIASFIYAIGISLFLAPNDLAPGGVSGVAVILNRIVGGTTGTWILLLNIPLLGIGLFIFRWKFFLSTAYCIMLSSFFVNRLSYVGSPMENDLLSAIVGGSFVALGLAITFMCGATTGGVDIIVKLLQRRYPYLKVGTLIFALDSFVVLCSTIAFRNMEKGIYGGISIVVTTWILDQILYGNEEARQLLIVSGNEKRIAKRILEELDVGVTFLQGEGAFLKNEKKIILCILKKQLVKQAKEIIMQEDSEAFVVVSKTSEIYGFGFKKWNQKATSTNKNGHFPKYI